MASRRLRYCVTPPSAELIYRGDRPPARAPSGARGMTGAGAHTLIFLHEGLGLHRMWRDFPQRLCDATRCPARSRPHRLWRLAVAQRPGVRYLAIESDVNPPAFGQARVEIACWWGTATAAHSRLNYAASVPSRCLALVRGPPHAVNEPVCVKPPARPATPSPRAICVSACGDSRDHVDGSFQSVVERLGGARLEPMDADGRLPESSAGAGDPWRGRRVRHRAASSASSPARSRLLRNAPGARLGPVRICSSRPTSCPRSPASWPRWRWFDESSDGRRPARLMERAGRLGPED